MNSTKASFFFLSSFIFSTEAFIVSNTNYRSVFLSQRRPSVTLRSARPRGIPYFLEEQESSSTHDVTETSDPKASLLQAPEKSGAPTVLETKNSKKTKVKKPNHKEGVFSPIVFASKKIIGEDNLNQLRGKVISLHSGVIGDFVDTHTTPIGSAIAQNLFVVIDSNNSGTLDKEELKAAFQTLGFTWLQEKQVEGIIQRADKDQNGVIDYEEFEAELSKTLRTNLIKLAKKNGEAMGLLV